MIKCYDFKHINFEFIKLDVNLFQFFTYPECDKIERKGVICGIITEWRDRDHSKCPTK